MSQDEQELAFAQLRIADARWEAALLSSAAAPPDLGFAGRLRAIGTAAEQEAAAFRAASAADLAWAPISNARDMTLSYELRRGGSRPGDPMLWQQFDEAVGALGDSFEGVALSAIVRSFAALADVSRRLADELDAIDTSVPAARTRTR